MKHDHAISPSYLHDTETYSLAASPVSMLEYRANTEVAQPNSCPSCPPSGAGQRRLTSLGRTALSDLARRMRTLANH